MKSSPRIVVVGSSNTDLVVQCDRLPGPGETVLGGRFRRFAGGKGANQAVAAARAGARVAFVGARGDDEFGRAAEAGLRRESVDTRFFRIRRGITSGVALILVGGKGRQNLIAVADSANGRLAPADVRRAAPLFRHASAVLCQLEVPLDAVMAAALISEENQVPFILNPAPFRDLPAGLLTRVHTLTPNEHELRGLSGVRGIRAGARALLARGCGRVVVTLGSRGALAVSPGACVEIAAPKVKPVDTVGAGDCFTAWLAVGIAEGMRLGDAATRAARAAAMAVTRPGAQAGMPWRREVRWSPSTQRRTVS